jgi:hypothetical protein
VVVLPLLRERCGCRFPISQLHSFKSGSDELDSERKLTVTAAMLVDNSNSPPEVASRRARACSSAKCRREYYSNCE